MKHNIKRLKIILVILLVTIIPYLIGKIKMDYTYGPQTYTSLNQIVFNYYYGFAVELIILSLVGLYFCIKDFIKIMQS